MRVAELRGPGSVAVDERDRPSPGRSELLVRVEACGVCATDHHLYTGALSAPYPLVPGHESVGEVVETGEGVERYGPGTRVAINPSVPCGECAHCKRGAENRCPDLRSIGGVAPRMSDGAFAEYVAVPAGNVEPVGDIPAATAAFAEPLGCCVHALGRVDLAPGDAVGVFGAGPIGLLLVDLLRTTGAGRIVVSEPVDGRRERAREVGATAVVDPTAADPVEAMAGDDGVDLAVEAVGLEQTLESAVAACGPGGTALVFGVPPEDASLSLDPFRVFSGELDLVGSYSLTPDSFARAVSLLRNGRIEPAGLVTGEYGLDDLPTAFEEMDRNEGLKKLVDPRR
ncbi:galactitol-1-phosphate 5-dehydrogenase [Halobacteriales archaeon QS_1_68_17]|nr:MAG: galactitol-1-phosphate 5-dehydrogenase [Halobacteriales archaeon QS_1_68_17]